MTVANTRLRLDGGDSINRGVAAWWPLNEGAGLRHWDLTGKYVANAATGASAPGWTVGAIGKARSFSAASGTNIAVADVNPLTATTNISLCAWVYISGVSTKGAFVVNGNPQTQNNGYAIGVGATDYDSNGNNLIGLLPGVAWLNFGIAIGTGWHFVAMTRDTATWRGYVDGVVSTTTFSNNPTAPSVGFGIGLLIGQEGPTTSRSFTGNMANVRLFNRALLPQEVRRLYRDPWAGTDRRQRTVVYAPTGAGVTLTPGAGTATYTGQAVTVSAGATVAPGAGAETYAGQQASVTAGASVAVGPGAVAYQGQLATVSEPITVAVGPGAVTYEGQGVTFSSGGLGGTLRRRSRKIRWDDVPAELEPVVALAENYAGAADVQRAVDDALMRFARIGARTSANRRNTLIDEMRRAVVAAVERAAEDDDEEALAALL